MLIAPGGSLGGARPKASIIDNKKQLWIAKFPSRYDTCNVGAWEMLANILANKSGIITASAQLKKLFFGKAFQFFSPHFCFSWQRFLLNELTHFRKNTYH